MKHVSRSGVAPVARTGIVVVRGSNDNQVAIDRHGGPEQIPRRAVECNQFLLIRPLSGTVISLKHIHRALIGPTLEALHLFGASAGAILALLAWVLGRGTLLSVVPIVMGGACLYSHFGVSAEMSELRALAFGPEGSAEIAGRYDQLHRVSLSIFITLGVAAIGLLLLHVRADQRHRGTTGVDRRRK